MNINLSADLDKRLSAFVKKGSTIRINLFTGSKKAQVDLDLKDGLDKDIIEAIGKVNVSLDFNFIDEVNEESSTIDDDKTLNSVIKSDLGSVSLNSSVRKPALPYVENEYDDIRNKIGDDLGIPVQTLSTSSIKHKANNESIPHTSQIIEKKEDLEYGQMKEMMLQMQQMILKLSQGKSIEDVENIDKVKKDHIDSIMDIEEFLRLIKEAGANCPEIDMSKKLSKEEAIELEKYRVNKPAYVVSSKGMLFIDDVGISIKHNLACNLSSIPIFKLSKSSDLINCLRNGSLKFVDYETAKDLSEKMDITALTEGSGDTQAFIGSDGDGVALAKQNSMNAGIESFESESASERILNKIAGSSKEGIVIEDVTEVTEEDTDEMSDIINLTGINQSNENASEALKASLKSKAQFNSKTWKPLKKSKFDF